MLGDAQDVRRLAARARLLAGQVRTTAAEMRSTAGVDWESAAAEAFRRRAAEHAGRLLVAADRLDDGATALSLHAEEVERSLVQLRAAAGFAGALGSRLLSSLPGGRP